MRFAHFTRKRVLYTVSALGFFGIAPRIHRADQIARDTTNALELNAGAKLFILLHAFPLHLTTAPR